MSGNNSSRIHDDKMLAYLYDDVDDADIFGLGEAEGEEDTKTNDDYDEEISENSLDTNSSKVLNENRILKETIQRLQQENETLDQRISEVYKTAKREIERKDSRIRELQEETNNILFRRNNNRVFGYREKHPISVKFQEQQQNRLESTRQQLSNIEDKSLKNKADDLVIVLRVSSSKNDINKDTKCSSNSTPSAFNNEAGNTAQKNSSIQIEDTNKDSQQQFNTNYKIPKKNADCSHDSKQKWCKSNVLGGGDGLTPTRQKKNLPGNTDYQDKSGNYPTTPSRNKKCQDNIRFGKGPKIPDPRQPRSKSDDIESQNNPKLANKQRSRSRTPVRRKSRSTSAENCVEADQIEKRVQAKTPSRKIRSFTEVKHRSSSKSPRSDKNCHDKSRKPKISENIPSRNKSRSTSAGNRIEADSRDINRKTTYPNTPSRKNTIVTDTNQRSSSSPQRYKNNHSPKPKTTTKSPVRHKSRSNSVENRTCFSQKEINRKRVNPNSPSREKSTERNRPNSSSRSPQRHNKKYQDRPRQPKPGGQRTPGRPLRPKSRSASVEAEPKYSKRERERSNSPTNENRSRSSQRHRNCQKGPKPPPRSSKRNKSRSASAGHGIEADCEVFDRERRYHNRPLKEHRSSSRSPQRHNNYQDRPRQAKPSPERIIRCKPSVGADPTDASREREQSNSTSREHGSSSRSSHKYRNCRERSRQTKPPSESSRRNKSRSVSAENKGERKTVAVDQHKRPPRTPPGSPSSTKVRRKPSYRKNADRRRQSRPPERETRRRNIGSRLGWGSKRGIYQRLTNDSVSFRRRTDIRRQNEYRMRITEQSKQRIIERVPEGFKLDRQERQYSGDDDTCKMTEKELERLIGEKEKELMDDEELGDIEEGELRDDDRNMNLPENAKKCKKVNKSKKETYKDLLKETKNITKQARKNILEIQKPEISTNMETKLVETIKSSDAEDPRQNSSSCDSKTGKPKARINFETYKRRREEEGCSDLTRIEIYQETDIENNKISEDCAKNIAESQKEDPEQGPKYINEKSDDNDHEPQEKAFGNLIESDYKYTPAVDDGDSKLDLNEDKNSLNSFYGDFDISEDDDRFGKNDNSSAENKKNQPQKDIPINAITISPKSTFGIKSLNAEDMDSNPIVKNSQPEATVVSINFKTYKQQNDGSHLASVESNPEVDITDKKRGEENVEIIDEHYEDQTSEKSLEKSDQKAEAKSVNKLIEPDHRNPPVAHPVIEEKVDISILKDNVKISDKIGSCCSEKIGIVEDVKTCDAKIAKVNILSNVVITAGFTSSLQTSKKSENMESSVESIESIHKAVLNTGIENKALGISEIKNSISQKSGQNGEELIFELFGEMTPSPSKPEPKVEQNSRQVQQAKRQLKLQVNPVKTIKRSPSSRKKVEPKQLLMQSEIFEKEQLGTRTVATKLEDLQHNNPTFIPFLLGDNKAFDTPNTYIKKKNEQKRKPAVKNSKETGNPKGKVKKRGVFRIKLQIGRKNKKIQNHENSSSELSCDPDSDCESRENKQELKMEPKKKKTRKSKTVKEKIGEGKKINPTVYERSEFIANEKQNCEIKTNTVKITDYNSENIGIKTNKTRTAKPVKADHKVKTGEKCDITKTKSENSQEFELNPNKRSRAKSVKFDNKVTDINVDKSKNIETNQTQTNKCQVKLSKVADDFIIAEDSSETAETKTNKRRQTVVLEEKNTVSNEDNFKNNQEPNVNKRNRTKPVKVVKTIEKFPVKNEDKTKDNLIMATIIDKTTSQAKPVEVSDNAKMEEKITGHNEDRTETSKNIRTNANEGSTSNIAKIAVTKIEKKVTDDKTENNQNVETKTRFQAKSDNLKIEGKITDFSKYNYLNATKRRRIQPTKVGEVTPSNKRKLDIQEDTIPNKLPKLEQSPLPHMESMLKQLENKSSPQTSRARECSNKITAINVEDGVVEININSKDVSLGPLDNLFMLEDLSNYLNVSDRKTETSFSNFQLKNTSTPKKPPEKKNDNVAKNLVENEMKEDKVSPISITSSSVLSKEYLKAPLRRDRTRRIRVGLVHLPS